MSSQTSLIAREYQLQKWAGIIRESKKRPDGMGIVEWCQQRNLTKSQYYYWLRRVREACLENIPEEATPQGIIVPVNAELLNPNPEKGFAPNESGLTITLGKISIQVAESTSMGLLASVLEVAGNVK